MKTILLISLLVLFAGSCTAQVPIDSMFNKCAKVECRLAGWKTKKFTTVVGEVTDSTLSLNGCCYSERGVMRKDISKPFVLISFRKPSVLVFLNGDLPQWKSGSASITQSDKKIMIRSKNMSDGIATGLSITKVTIYLN